MCAVENPFSEGNSICREGPRPISGEEAPGVETCTAGVSKVRGRPSTVTVMI